MITLGSLKTTITAGFTLMRMRALAALMLAGGVAWAQVAFTRASHHVDVVIGGRPFTTFEFPAAVYKPWLAPIRSAAGVVVTREWPMLASATDTDDHPHHRGIFFGHIAVNGFDFWGNDPLNKPEPNGGRILLRRLDEVSAAGDKGTIRATFDWKDPQGRIVLTEHRTMVFYSDPKLRTIDFDFVLTAAEPVTFGDDKDGTFAIRVATAMNEEHTGTLVNAEGAEHEKNTWGHRSPWMDYFGTVDGQKLGIAMMDHPSNPGYPNHWHCRAYGLFSLNLFGQHAFDPALPVKETKLAAGASLHFRFRLVIHPGDAKSADVAQLFRAWSGQQ